MAQFSQPATGLLLISDPFLQDPNFQRTVVLLCEHNAEGSFGFVVNRKLDYFLEDVLNNPVHVKMPLYYGGPVQQDTLHFVHTAPDLIQNSIRINDGLYWGGNFDMALKYVNRGAITNDEIRFFVGYSGWSAGQLDEELKINSWLLTDANAKLVLRNESNDVWKKAVKQLDPKYHEIIHYPTNPMLN